MESPIKVVRGRRKENIPPHLSCDATPEQRHIQKNVNINLSLAPFMDVAVSRRSSRAAVPSSNSKRAAAQGKPELEAVGGAKRHRRVLVQTNLSCPYPPFWEPPCGVSGGSSRQQSNLETKLRCRRVENAACVGNPSCLRTVGLGSGCSCLDRARVKSGPEDDFSGWSQKSGGGHGLCGVPHPCNEISQHRTGDKDPHILRHPRACFCMSEESCGTAGDSFCPTQPYERPFPHDQCLHPESSSRIFSSLPPGPGLTLDHLRSSTSVESHVTSATLHVLLRSSQVSADLHSSIQHLKREAASMGALSSFPGEPKSLLLPHPSRFDPPVSSSGRPSTTEQFAVEESCAKQASVKWRNSFARGWGMGSPSCPHPLGCGCRNTGLYTPSMEASGPFWPSAFCGGVGSASLVHRGEEDCSNPSCCHVGSCSRIHQVPERKGPTSRLKTHYQQNVLDPGELSSRFFRCHELGYGEAPLCHPSFDGLEVSLETLRAGPPLNVGVTVDSTHGEVRMTVRSPEVDLLGNGSRYTNLRALQDEAEGTGGVLPTPQVMGESVLFLPAHNSLEEMAGKSLGGPSTAAVDGLSPIGFGGTAPVSKNPSNGDCWPEAGKDQGDTSLTEKNVASSEFPGWEESRRGMDAAHETLGRKDGSMDGERSRVPPQSALLLANYFAAWRNQVFGKNAAAQALYGRQRLRKGLGALKWAVGLQHVQAGIAQWRHNRTVLASCFRRWQCAMVKQQKDRASQVEMETPNKDSPAVLGGEKIVKGPVLLQLSAEYLEAATQYGRAEGNLWLQICRNQGVDEPGGKAQTVRDMRRLAAAFRLWRLQKERLDEEASHAQDARALLEKKRLRNAFEIWRSRYRATERILPLVARIQRRMVSRCFDIWKGCAERESHARCTLDHRRVGALRLCFQQWAQMVQVQERARETLLELLALRRRIAYARFGFALNAPKMQPHLIIGRQFQRNGSDSLDGLCIALMLQETFYTWKARWHQQQRLDAFRQAAEQKLLRRALGRWCWRAPRPSPFKRRAEDLAEDPLLTPLDLDEHSVSSGFHSNAPALRAFRDSWEREGSLMASRPGSVSSLATITDASHLLQHPSPPPTPSPGQEDPEDEAVEFRAQASSPLGDQCSRTDGFVRDSFQSSGLLHPECGIHSIAASSSGGVASPGGEEKEIFENQRQLLARCFALWSSWTLQNSKGKQLRRRRLLSGAFISWSVAAARTSEQRKAQVWLGSIRQQRLLASCFARWKAELSRAQQQREEEHSLRRRPPGSKAVQRWRKAVRGYQALRLGTGTVVQQSCNYWTKAAAFHRCLRERSSLLRAPKCMKMPLSWPNKQRRNREEGLPPSVAVRARLKGSAFHVWLVIYRSQRSMAGSSPQAPPDSPGRTEWRVKHSEIRSSGAEMDSTRWLWRKYLRLWRCNVLLRRFQEAWRMRHLARAWLLWKDTCQAEWVVQALVRQRLAVWGWKAWRRHYLQTRVAERFLEAQDRSLLKRAFGRWRDLAAEEDSQPQGSFYIPQPVLPDPGADLTKV